MHPTHIMVKEQLMFLHLITSCVCSDLKRLGVNALRNAFEMDLNPINQTTSGGNKMQLIAVAFVDVKKKKEKKHTHTKYCMN